MRGYIKQTQFSGNPICLHFVNDTAIDSTAELRVSIGSSIFTENYMVKGFGNLTIDLQEILQDMVSMPQENNEVQNSVLYKARGYTSIFINAGAEVLQKNIRLFYGGISEDIISDSLDSDDEFNQLLNKILSTRNHNNIINVAMEELRPLMFFIDKSVIVQVHNSLGQLVFEGQTDYDICVYALNLSSFINEEEKYFKITIGETIAYLCIVESPKKPARLATFINSYGVYESLLLTGEGSKTRQMDSVDEVNRFDSTRQMYLRTGQRKGSTEVLMLYAGYKTVHELQFINDLISSERIYIDGKEMMCTTEEHVEYADTDIYTPREVELTFERVMKRKHHTPL
ncbi:MAG: hypothetical protein ACRCZB_03515 [Bacteroidales bacterium]